MEPGQLDSRAPDLDRLADQNFLVLLDLQARDPGPC